MCTGKQSGSFCMHLPIQCVGKQKIMHVEKLSQSTWAQLYKNLNLLLNLTEALTPFSTFMKYLKHSLKTYDVTC